MAGNVANIVVYRLLRRADQPTQSTGSFDLACVKPAVATARHEGTCNVTSR